LARALDGDSSATPEPEAAAVAHLLEAARGTVLRDEVSRLRLRSRVMTLARPRRIRFALPLAAAVLLGLLGGLTWRHLHPPPSERLLAAREAAARAAVHALAGRTGAVTSPTYHLVAGLERERQQHLLERLEAQHLDLLRELPLPPTWPAPDLPPGRPFAEMTPTPGGPS
jgi:hypothetical protein